MAFHSASSDSDEAALSDINITPLVDVMLVLLVAFIVTAPLMSNAVRVQLPQTVATQAPEPAKPVHVSIDAQGGVFLDKDAVDLQALHQKLVHLRSQRSDVTLHLSADERVRHGDVAKVLALIEKAGITRLAVLTQAQ